jgi:hypothetical protein
MEIKIGDVFLDVEFEYSSPEPENGVGDELEIKHVWLGKKDIVDMLNTLYLVQIEQKIIENLRN